MNAPAVMQIAHELLVLKRCIKLESRDLALLLLVKDELNRRAGAFWLTARDLLTLSIRLDRMEVVQNTKARSRLTGSIERLVESDCLMRVDLNQVGHADEAQYQLTTVGMAWVEWELDRVRFTGAPLVALMRVFNTQIEGLIAALPLEVTEQIWQDKVEVPARAVVSELLHGINRHQMRLDREHPRLRDEIPILLSNGGDEALARCESQLREVQLTVRDLHDATTSYGTTALNLLAELREHEARLSPDHQLCREMERRLLAVMTWAAQRSQDWSVHYQSVHQLIRTVIRVDRERRVTSHLKKALASVPDWTLAVADAPRCYRLRNEADDIGHHVKHLRRPRIEYAPDEYVREVDEFPAVLLEVAREHLARGHASWSEVLREAMGRCDRNSVDVLRYLPRLMACLVCGGEIDPTQRDQVPFNQFLLEELRVAQR